VPLPPASLRLTDGGGGEAGSAFTTSRVEVDNFTTTFTFQLHGGSATPADGFAFVIQGASPLALGGGGGGLGYGSDRPGGPQGIPNSIAVKFDIYDNAGEGNNSTGLFLNGDSPTQAVNPGEAVIDLNQTVIDLRSGHVFTVTLTYDGNTLTEDIIDTATGGEFMLSYGVDIVGIVGGNVAYVGFTGATGGLTTIADVLNWSYTFTEPNIGPAPRPGGSGSHGSPGGTAALPLDAVLAGSTAASGTVAGVPALVGRSSSSGQHGRSLADLLASAGPSQADGILAPHQVLGSGAGSDPLGQDLDTSAIDAAFARL
jgi:hypothetical protein